MAAFYEVLRGPQVGSTFSYFEIRCCLSYIYFNVYPVQLVQENTCYTTQFKNNHE